MLYIIVLRPVSFARIIKIINFAIYHKYFMSEKYHIKLSHTKGYAFKKTSNLYQGTIYVNA